MLNLDVAERLARAGHRDDASVHLHGTMAWLPREHRYGIITRRAGEIADVIPT